MGSQSGRLGLTSSPSSPASNITAASPPPSWATRCRGQAAVLVISHYTTIPTLTLTLAMLQVRLPGGSWGHASREPLGVVGGVGAWNYPLQTCTWKVLGTVQHSTALYCTVLHVL